MKQNNHLSKNVGSLDDGESKLICCSTLVLVGLSFKNQNEMYEQGLSMLQKVVKNFGNFLLYFYEPNYFLWLRGFVYKQSRI